jgi:two-component system, OmpR family, sensor histidine kinase KdpD
MPRGQHKVFLGMAVGVGKTYRMLQEGHSVDAEGSDVAIGLLETHGRPETAAMATGLELIPRRSVPFQSSTVEEMDLPAILTRAPDVCLIDEIAHTNAPGLEHRKRYEDVEDILAAGITVFSTVNVQHLESVSQRIAEKTGIVIEETMPDQVVDEADEVAVVDLTPEALRARILEGKVFPASSVPVALERFFTKNNLDVLREMALLQVVEEVEAHRLTAELLNEDRLISSVAAEREHRFLGLVKPDPSANRIVRRAWEISERLGGPLDLLWVAPEREDDEPETNQRVDDLRRLASVFGAELIVERDRDVARAVTRVAKRSGTTHIVMGIPHLRKRFGRLQRSIVDQLVASAPTLQLALVGDPQPTRANLANKLTPRASHRDRP